MDQLNEEEWRKIRVGKFTSSEIGKLLKGGSRPMTEAELDAREKGNRRTTVETVFGDGALTYMREVMHEILTGTPKYTPTTFAMERGLQLEPNAIQALRDLKKVDIQHFGAANPKFFPLNELSGGSPDALTDPDVNRVVEIKCPESKFVDYLSISRGYKFGSSVPYAGENYNEWLKDYDFDYYCQMQMNMLVTGYSKGWFVAYDDRPISKYKCNIAVLDIKQDSEIQSLIIDRIDKATNILLKQIEILGL
jgi:hypothetical protein